MPCFRCLIILPVILLLSCETKNPSGSLKQQQVVNEEAIRQQFIKANQQLVQKESDEMDYYEKTHGLQFIKTGSGIRYHVYSASSKGDSIRRDNEITMDYTLSLLDGTECYSSKENGPKTFVVEHEDLESGIHKAVQYLKHGDKAIILIPSHLAHGLLGDQKKIPPQMPIVYDVHIH